MFGIVRPHLSVLTDSQKSSYHSMYCNLCGHMKGAFGTRSRALVVHDIASIGWLLMPDEYQQSELPFKRLNCLRGCGTKMKHHPMLAEMATLSAWMMTLKFNDNQKDSDSIRSRTIGQLFQGVFANCLLDLEASAIDSQEICLQLSKQEEIERTYEFDLFTTSRPTATCYGAVLSSLATYEQSMLCPKDARILGEAIGAAVYIADAIKDYTKDVGRSFNPLVNRDGGEQSRVSEKTLGDARRFIADSLATGHAVVQRTGRGLERKWHSLERAIMAACGVTTSKDVTLYMTCCVPCGDGAIAVDSNDCNKAFTWCCCVPCLLCSASINGC